MKKVYVAHPLRGPGPLDVMAVVRNKQRIDEICMGIKIEHPDVLIYSPLHNLSWESALGDQSTKPRREGTSGRGETVWQTPAHRRR